LEQFSNFDSSLVNVLLAQGSTIENLAIRFNSLLTVLSGLGIPVTEEMAFNLKSCMLEYFDSNCINPSIKETLITTYNNETSHFFGIQSDKDNPSSALSYLLIEEEKPE
jgi:hypothetical protein